MANSIESNLSRKPPWPGIRLPLSFTLAIRFNLDSSRSPNVPAIVAIKEINMASWIKRIPVKVLIKEIIITLKMIPPRVPSQVFFGEVFESCVFPNKEPTTYAIVSLIQIEKTIKHG